MSAVLASRAGLLPHLRHAGVLLRHGASLPQRVLAVLLSGVFALAALAAAMTVDAPQRLPVALVLAGLAVLVLWGVWIARLALLHAEARQVRMPGVGAGIAGALALVALASAGIPGLLFGIAGMNLAIALAVLVVAACTGLLVALLPRIVYFALCFAPLAFGLLAAVWQRWGPAIDLLPALRPAATDVFWLVPVMLSLAAWRWQAVLRQSDRPDLSSWWQPAVASSPRALTGSGWLAGFAGNQELPDWMWPSGQTTGAGPANPVRAMRAILGTPFAPLSAGQILVQLGIGALVVAYLVLEGLGEGGDPGLLVGGVIGGGGVLVVMYGQRLEAMNRKRSGESDELALLPGFGDAETQRRHLLRAVAWSPSWACAAVLLALLAIGSFTAGDWRLLVLMLMAGVGMVLMTAVGCMRPIAGQRLDGLRMLLLAGPVLVLALGTTMYAEHADGTGLAPLVLALSWLLLYAVAGAALVSSVRRFRERPHPFVQP